MAAPLTEGDMSRSTVLNKEDPSVVLRFLAQSKAHRQMRAENMIDKNFGNRPLAEKLLLENENFMEMWRTTLAYIDSPDDMGQFMSNKHLLDKLLPLMVQGGNYWWTPCGLSLWCCLTPDSFLVVPCYYMQAAFVWGLCCPLSQCSRSCYGALVGPLAPQTKLIDDRKVAELEKIINSAIAEAAADLEKNATWEYTKSKSDDQYLHSEEIITTARFSLAAYLPTVDKGEVVYYSDFVPLVRERFIEKRFREQNASDAMESLNSFVQFFFTPSDPDTRSGAPKFGHGRPIKDALAQSSFELVEGFDIGTTDTQGYIAKAQNYDENGGDVVLAFRGTTSIKDWAVNMSGRQVAFDPDNKGRSDIGFVHGGFYWAFTSVLGILKSKLIPLLEKGKSTRLIITGHSLGGALATLSTAFFMAHYENSLPSNVNQVLTVTFGNPKVGNKDFCDYVNKRTTGGTFKAYRMHNEMDPVPRTPPKMLGFYHCFTRAILTPDGRVYFPPDEAKSDGDVTTRAIAQFASVGSEILAFHDIFVYADATYQFKARQEAGGKQGAA